MLYGVKILSAAVAVVPFTVKVVKKFLSVFEDAKKGISFSADYMEWMVYEFGSNRNGLGIELAIDMV